MYSQTLEFLNPAEQIRESLVKEFNLVTEAMKILQKYNGWSDKKTQRMIRKLYYS